MPAADDHSLKNAIRRYLRRTQTLDGLKALATQTFAQATETVTLTSLSAEGGAQAGQITCPKGLLLDVLEELIEQLDSTVPRDSSAAVFVSR